MSAHAVIGFLFASALPASALAAPPEGIAAPETGAGESEAASRDLDAGPQPVPPAPRRARYARVEVGAAYARLFTVPYYVGQLRVAGGEVHDGRHAVGGAGHLELGRTEAGLLVLGARGGVEWEYRLGPVGLGLDGRAGVLFLKRETRDAVLASLAPGIGAHVTLDVVSLDGSDAVTLTPGAFADLYLGDDPVLTLSGVVALGYRWSR